MKYKLKEHVTDEMLEEVGFEMDRHVGLIHGTRPCDNYDGEIYVILTWGMKTIQGDELLMQWNDERENDITPYIQDLIELDYVEEMEWK